MVVAKITLTLRPRVQPPISASGHIGSSPAKLDGDVLAFDKAALFESLCERAQLVWNSAADAL